MGDWPLAVAQDVMSFLYVGTLCVSPDTVAHVLLLADQWCLDSLRAFDLATLTGEYCKMFRKPRPVSQGVGGVT